MNVANYDNRLEISSTGGLPFGLTTESLFRVHQSRPWNPIMAQVFYRRGIIESWGGGTLRIIELSERAGLVQPEFIEEAGEVLVCFRPGRYAPPARLTFLQRTLLDVLTQMGSASLKQIREQIPPETAERTVQDNLQTLRRKGFVDVIGQGRGAQWVIKELYQRSGRINRGV